MQERLKYLAELPELTKFFFEEPTAGQVSKLFNEPPDKQLQKIDKNTYAKLLKPVTDSLEASDFSREDIAERLNKLLTELYTKPGVLFALVRIAITGSASSPELFGTLAVLGKEKSLNRLKAALLGLEK